MDNHDLDREFPEFLADLTDLRARDPHFARLADEYKAVDHQVLGIEQNVEPASDLVTEELKKRRVRLKDEIYSMLRQHRAQP